MVLAILLGISVKVLAMFSNMTLLACNESSRLVFNQVILEDVFQVYLILLLEGYFLSAAVRSKLS